MTEPTPDPLLEEQIATLDDLCAGREPTPAVNRARILLLRAHKLRRDDFLRRAPRLRRYVLHDLRSATLAVRSETP